jgi:hypothetical protein
LALCSIPSVLLSCLVLVLHDVRNLQAAFEHCVRAYVIRCECVPLGPGHPDTAAAGHNLGVVLDCLGKSSRGLQLVEQAQQVRGCDDTNHCTWCFGAS